MVTSIRSMFSSIARKYVWTNTIITLGLDRVWRQRCAKECASGFVPGSIILDLCCGTGDLSQAISGYLGKDVFLVGADFNKEMLSEAVRKKRERRNQNMNSSKSSEVLGSSFVVADVANLPLRSDSVERVGIAFGLRNLMYKNPRAKRHLSEIARIIQKGGRFVCVETSQPKIQFFRLLLRLYFLRLVPIVGWLISNSKGSYEYLGSSSANFKSTEEVPSMLISSGFRKVHFKQLTFGTVTLFNATK